MSHSKILTQEIAKQFLKDEGSVDLWEYTSLDDDAAQLLAKHEGELDLTGLLNVSESNIQILARHNGDDLRLCGLKSISDSMAIALAGTKGNLWISGITTLSDSAACALAQHKGGMLNIERVEKLTDLAIQALASHEGEIWIYGVKSLSQASIQSLIQDRGNFCIDTKLLNEMLIKNLTSPTEGVKGSLTYKWDPIFLKGVNSRWQKAVKNCDQGKGEFLLFDEFESVEILMAELVSQGNSAESIYLCMDAKDIAGGGDRACQLAVELAWLLGSWDATWKELQTEAEEQCARSMAECSSSIVAEAYKIDK